MTVFLFGLFMIVLGCLAASSFVEAKVPAAIPYISRIKPYEEGIGVTAFFLGVCCLIEFVFYIGYWMYALAMGLLMLGSGLICIALGLVLGLAFLSKRLRDPVVSFPILPRFERARAALLPYQKIMGEAAIAMGVIYFVIAVMRLFSGTPVS